MHIEQMEQRDIINHMARAIAAAKDAEGQHGVREVDYRCAKAAWRIICQRLGIEDRTAPSMD